MSNLIAVRCDYCGKVVHEDEAVGISLQQDMFSSLNSYPFVYKNITKEKCHVCIECTKVHVLIPVSTVSRAKDETIYNAKKDELYFILRKKCVENFNSRRKKN
jgi:hypothetical protein